MAITAAADAAALRRTAALRSSAPLCDAFLLRAAVPLPGAAPLRRAAPFHAAAPPHGPHLPGSKRFGRPRDCYRVSGPPDMEEGSQKTGATFEDLEKMDREALLQYIKRVTAENRTLLEDYCKYDPSYSMKDEISHLSGRLGKMQETAQRCKDITSENISRRIGSVNLLVVGMFILTMYEVFGDKLF